MSFSIFFLGWEEVLQGKVSLDDLTIAIGNGDEVIPLGTCTARDAVGDVIEAVAFATNSCEGVKELYLRSGKWWTFRGDSAHCQDNKDKLILTLGTYEPMSCMVIRKQGGTLEIEVYEEDLPKTKITLAAPEFVSSALGFVRSFLTKFPDEELMRELGIVEGMARRKGLIPPGEKFEIKVEWLGEVKCGEETFPLVYASISRGREIFSGLVEPTEFAGDLINLLKFSQGNFKGMSIQDMPVAYVDWFKEGLSLLGWMGSELVEESFILLTFGSEHPKPVFVFKKGREVLLVSPYTKTLVKLSAGELFGPVKHAVEGIIEDIKQWDGTLFGGWTGKEAASMLEREINEAPNKRGRQDDVRSDTRPEDPGY